MTVQKINKRSQKGGVKTIEKNDKNIKKGVKAKGCEFYTVEIKVIRTLIFLQEWLKVEEEKNVKRGENG